MYTIFSCPKEFTSLFGIIQRNAINSWLKLSPKPNIILFGIENENIKNEFNDENITPLQIEKALWCAGQIGFDSSDNDHSGGSSSSSKRKSSNSGNSNNSSGGNKRRKA